MRMGKALCGRGYLKGRQGRQGRLAHDHSGHDADTLVTKRDQ